MIINYDKWVTIIEWRDFPNLFKHTNINPIEWFMSTYEISRDDLMERDLVPLDLFRTSEGDSFLSDIDIYIDDAISTFVCKEPDNIYVSQSYDDGDERATDIFIISKEHLMLQLGDLNDIFMHSVRGSNEEVPSKLPDL